MQQRLETERYILTIRNRSGEFEVKNMAKSTYTLVMKYRESMAQYERHSDGWQNYRDEINNRRHRLRRMGRRVYDVTVKLKDRRYGGYLLNHTMELNEYDQFSKRVKAVIRHALQMARKGLKPKTHLRNLGHTGNMVQCAGKHVMAVPGQILKIAVQRQVKALYDDKRPADTKRHVGIELEFCAPISEEELALKLFKAGVHKYAQLKQDHSLRPKRDENGYELAVLMTEANFKRDIRKVLSVLNSVKAVAQDRRAGLHIHLDMRKRNKDLVYNNLVSCQQALFQLVDPARAQNEFCRIVGSRRFPTSFAGNRDDRYKTINAAAYYKYGTLEVRMHEGSVDVNHIIGWTELLIKIANYKKKLERRVDKLTILNKRLKLDPKTFKYAVDRNCYWQVNARSQGISSQVGSEMQYQETRDRQAEAQPRQQRSVSARIRSAFGSPVGAAGTYRVNTLYNAVPLAPPQQSLDYDSLVDMSEAISNSMDREFLSGDMDAAMAVTTDRGF